MEHVTRLPSILGRNQPSWESLAIAEHLEQCPVGAFVSYAALTAIAGGRDIQRQAHYILRTARAIVLRKGFVFDVVTNQGLTRLGSTGMVRTSEKRRAHVYRTVRKGAQILRCANYQEMDAATRERAICYAGLFTALATVSHVDTVQKAVELVNNTTAQTLSPGTIFQLFASTPGVAEGVAHARH